MVIKISFDILLVFDKVILLWIWKYGYVHLCFA